MYRLSFTLFCAWCVAADPGLVTSLQAEVDRLNREVKQLQLENQNMFWLADEYKRLKAELAQHKPQ